MSADQIPLVAINDRGVVLQSTDPPGSSRLTKVPFFSTEVSLSLLILTAGGTDGVL